MVVVAARRRSLSDVLPILLHINGKSGSIDPYYIISQLFTTVKHEMKLSVWFIAAQQVSAQAVQLADWEPDCARRPNGSNHVPGVCTQYYQCAGGKPRSEPAIRECPEGLAFNGKWCVLKDQARCDAKWRLPKEAKGKLIFI